jgi:Recombination endonuclease VII
LSEFRFIRKNKNGTDLYKARCVECDRKQQLKRYHNLTNDEKIERKNKSIHTLGKDYFKKYKLNKHYNLTLEEFHFMYESQNGKCYICEKEITGREVKVDHNHLTGKVRKLLCHNCNTSLGLLNEDVKIFEKCIEYLKTI